MDSDHTGFTGTGFVNTANAVGAYVDIPVTAAVAGTKTLAFQGRFPKFTSLAREPTVPMATGSPNGDA